jgi:tripartite-type tricarboxylate transporter receptor subunit TctC
VRHRAIPEVPTFREQGYDIEGFGWYGAYAPGGLNAATAERIGGAVVAAIRNPAVAERLAALGMEPTGLPGPALATIQRADYDRWGPIIRASGFKAE